MAALLVILAAALVLVSALWLIGAAEPVYSIRSDTRIWFVALRTNEPLAKVFASDASVLWTAESDFAFIGARERYWTHFAIVTGDGAPALANNSTVQDAYIARLRLFAPPHLALGLLRALVSLGILSRPRGEGARDASALGLRSDLMPGAEAISSLLARPASYRPAMVNFLEYVERTPSGEPGSAAYRRYGKVALRTVFRTGGALLFYGAVEEVVRMPRAGPTLGRWHELAAMRYPSPPAILIMESVPSYRAALAQRDEGLARTVVIAAHE